MDGLPGLRRGLATARVDGVAPIEKMVGPRAPAAPHDPGQLRLALAGGVSAHVRMSTALTAALLAFLLGVLVGPALVGHVVPLLEVAPRSM